MYISTIRCCCSLDISRINKKVKKMPEKPAYKNINNSFLSHNIFYCQSKKHIFCLLFIKKCFVSTDKSFQFLYKSIFESNSVCCNLMSELGFIDRM